MEALSKRGHRIRVIDYEARWKPGRFSDSLARKSFNSVHRTDQESSVTLIRPGMAKLPGIARVSSAATHFRDILQQTIKWCDAIVLYSVPTNGIQAVVSAKLAHKPILFHSFDVLHRMTGYRLLSAPTWAMERFIYRHVDKIVVISASLEKYMRDIGVSQANLIQLPPAVNTERFSQKVSGKPFRKQIGLSSDDKIVLFSGWLYSFCGIDMIMQSWGKLARDIPNLKLLVCGDGPMLATLEKIQKENHLEDQVKLLRRRPFDEMPAIIAAADLCVNPYLPEVRSNYAFPSKLVEYMSMGKPVLATDLPGTRSMLPPDSGVWLVPPKDFVLSMRDWLCDTGKLRDAGRKSQEFCSQFFSLEKIVDRFEQLLAEMVESQGRR